MRLPQSAVLLPLLVACASHESDSVEAIVSDSAGVAVVTHSEITDVLELDRTAPVLLGAGTDVEDSFYRVRGGALLPDDRIAIANAGSNELLFFGVDGHLVGRFGREGQGPEEFSNLFRIQGLPDGAVVANDPGNARLVWVTPTGELAFSRSVNFSPEDSSPDRSIVGRGFVFGVTTSGEVLAVPWARAVFRGSEGPLPLRGELRRYASDLDSFVAIDSVRLRLWFEQAQPQGPPITQILGSPLLVFSANRDWMAYSEGDAHRITVLLEGAVEYVVHERRSRTPFHVDSIPPGYHHAADSLPTYTELVVDSEGRIWVRAGTPESAGTAEWRIFSNRGTRGSLLYLPARTSVLDARGERVLVLERNELDVERVVLLRAR